MKTAALAAIMAFALLLPGCNVTTAVPDTETPPGMRNPAPDFDLENIAGGRTKAADLKGKILVVDIWATWCEPCIAEIPRFNQLSDEYKDKAVQVVGITVESPYDHIKPKVQETGIKYLVLVGNDAVVDGFGGLVGFPTTYVVTKDWKIYKKYMGALPDKDKRIKKDIEKLLAAEPANTD